MYELSQLEKMVDNCTSQNKASVLRVLYEMRKFAEDIVRIGQDYVTLIDDEIEFESRAEIPLKEEYLNEIRLRKENILREVKKFQDYQAEVEQLIARFAN